MGWGSSLHTLYRAVTLLCHEAEYWVSRPPRPSGPSSEKSFSSEEEEAVRRVRVILMRGENMRHVTTGCQGPWLPCIQSGDAVTMCLIHWEIITFTHPDFWSEVVTITSQNEIVLQLNLTSESKHSLNLSKVFFLVIFSRSWSLPHIAWNAHMNKEKEVFGLKISDRLTLALVAPSPR